MNIWQAIVLGLVQGVTEFVPVSSSGHLVLVPWLLGWTSSGLAFDTLVHWGTLVAVLIYFGRDWWTLITTWLRSLIHPEKREAPARLMWLLILGTLPAAALGYLGEEFFESLFGQPMWVSLFLLGTAGILVISEWRGRPRREIESLHWRDALAIGCGQALAIVPGISRSGATLSVGLLRGLPRAMAARFSFLLSTPIILGAGLFQLITLLSEPEPAGQALTLFAGFLSAALSGYFCIWFLLRYLQRRKLYPFAIYCAVAGGACFVIALGR